MRARVQDGSESSEPFSVSNGVKQGCVLAPTLFSLTFSAMLTDAFDGTDTGIGIKWRFDGSVFNLRRLQAKTKVQSDTINDLHLLMILPSTLPARQICSIALTSSLMPATTLALLSAQTKSCISQHQANRMLSQHHHQQPTAKCGGQVHVPR